MTRRVAMMAFLLLAGVFSIAGHAAQDYRIRAGDLIRVDVFAQPDLNAVARVSERGAITFNPIGPVNVAGMTERDVEKTLAKRLESAGIVTSAQVKVSVEEFNLPLVPVLGKVSNPGEYPIDEETTVVQLIAKAGGLSKEAGDVAVLNRSSGGNQTPITIDLADILQSGSAVRDVPVRAGDTIFVPPAPVVYVYGEVNRPGAYRLERNMRVMQAISVAGGLTLRGTTRGLTVNREINGKPSSVGVDLDDPLRPDDVLNIKESLF